MWNRKLNYYLFFAVIIMASAFSNRSWALPSQKRLWEMKYGYVTSCSLCHSKGGGSQVNSYGEDFQRFGMTPGAFASIEKRDSDKDGTINIDEIKAKSNPGDFNSTPQKPTDWLSRVEESMLPVKELQRIFPDSKKFSSLEGTLFPEQAKQIEKDLGKKLADADSVPTFYFAIKDNDGKATRVGVALFSTPSINPEKLIVGVGIDLSGKIKNVVLIKNKLNKALNDEKFLNQFKEKTSDFPIQINKDIQPAAANLVTESDQVVEAVKKSLMIIRVVFNKKAINVEDSYEYAQIKKVCAGGIGCIVDRILSPRP